MTKRPTGDIIAPPMPCNMRASDEFPEVVGDSATDRAQHKNADRGAEHGARAEPVRHPAGKRDEDREAQEIASDREVEPQRVDIDIARDRRQRGRDDRRNRAAP